MAENLSVAYVDDYTMSLVSSQPVVGFFSLPQGVTVPAPVEPEVVGDEVADDEGDEATAKVVKAPARRKAGPKTTEGVETK